MRKYNKTTNLKRINSFVVSILVTSCENRQLTALAPSFNLVETNPWPNKQDHCQSSSFKTNGALFSSLHSIHSRAARIIFNLDSSICDAEFLLNSHYFFILIPCLFGPVNCFQRVSSKSLRAINQMFIPRPKSKVERNSLRYRGPLLWNYVNKMIDVSSTLSVSKLL